ncbi:hypothetical protein [Sphingomonas bacterium]|uniref:hypothetical protein n=1 Tax=Sphingomonas bacterium TaxID=1895847 RepID=UPI001576373A|nr:hypothetical protein [Sphingomonas bacterium]
MRRIAGYASTFVAALRHSFGMMPGQYFAADRAQPCQAEPHEDRDSDSHGRI